MKTILLLLLCGSMYSQCPVFNASNDTIMCNTSNVTLWASGGVCYHWTTNGANKHQDSAFSYFKYPYTWSGTVYLTAMCGNHTYTKTIQVKYTYCTGINEYENQGVEPEYFDLQGNKTEFKPGQVLIKKVGNYRIKICSE